MSEKWPGLLAVACLVLLAFLIGMVVMPMAGKVKDRVEAEVTDAAAPVRVPGVDFQSNWVKSDEYTTSTGIVVLRTIAGRDTDASSPSVHTVVIGRVPAPAPAPAPKPAPEPKKEEPKPVSKPKR